MKTTTQTVSDRNNSFKQRPSRLGELWGLFLASSLVCFGLLLVSRAKATHSLTPFDQVNTLLQEKRLVNLNTLQGKDDLLTRLKTGSPFSEMFAEDERPGKPAAEETMNLVAGQMADFLKGRNSESVSALVSAAAPRVARQDIKADGTWGFLQARLERVRLRATKSAVREWLHQEKNAANEEKRKVLEIFESDVLNPFYDRVAQEGEEPLLAELEDAFESFTADDTKADLSEKDALRVAIKDQSIRVSLSARQRN